MNTEQHVTTQPPCMSTEQHRHSKLNIDENRGTAVVRALTIVHSTDSRAMGAFFSRGVVQEATPAYHTSSRAFDNTVERLCGSLGHPYDVPNLKAPLIEALIFGA